MPNSREVDENGRAVCNVCKGVFSIGELEDKCAFCGKWFCRSCARNTPRSHGSGKICETCYDKIMQGKL